ncbi:MAG: hypothetical protein KBC33_00145 [Candidatus Pacebacteria bacterium]|nr:hypothetical protein [Candidatus Paceibacterota bacterium]
MSKINLFLGTLDSKHQGFQWYGREFPSSFLRQRGAFVCYAAYVDGFEIQISKHDYTGENFPTGVPRGVRWGRKNLPDGALQWIEVTVSDNEARFGRRSILDKELVLPGTPQHKKLEDILKEIGKVARLFTPKVTERLSSDRALIGFCKSI